MGLKLELKKKKKSEAILRVEEKKFLLFLNIRETLTSRLGYQIV